MSLFLIVETRLGNAPACKARGGGSELCHCLKKLKVEDVGRRGAVILGFSFAVVGGKRDQANRFGHRVQFVLDESLMVVCDLDRRLPMT